MMKLDVDAVLPRCLSHSRICLFRGMCDVMYDLQGREGKRRNGLTFLTSYLILFFLLIFSANRSTMTSCLSFYCTSVRDNLTRFDEELDGKLEAVSCASSILMCLIILSVIGQ